MRIPNSVAREIVERVLTGEDYRPVIVQLIDTEFLNYVLDFFRQIVDAKLDGQRIIPIVEPEFTNSCACRIPPLPALSPPCQA